MDAVRLPAAAADDRVVNPAGGRALVELETGHLEVNPTFRGVNDRFLAHSSNNRDRSPTAATGRNRAR